mmetsp:Transcript_2401/g.6835  ORF Transcript_2401/g.6835 Transcript_2401/m.6835 type:complete len:198 (-) Transcript_2401:320-913(-)
MSYRHGVLIHNFNEDQFGIDLQSLPKPPDAPKVSVSHVVHSWKEPDVNERIDPGIHGVPRHILFGHTGDMRDPHTNLQKTEFATASNYFLQDPATVPHVGHLTADGFTISDAPLKTLKDPSVIAERIKDGWGNKRQTHSLPPGDRFTSEHMKSFGGGVPRRPLRPFDFTRSLDAAKLTSSRTDLRGGLRNTGRLMVA